MNISMGKREVYILLAAIVVVVGALVYPVYFSWWDDRSCVQSGGTFDEAAGKCIEPRNADIPNTSQPDH